MDDWTADLDKSEARHISGIVVKFAIADDGAVEGAPVMPLPASITVSDIARLMREAGEAFAAARRKRN